MNKKYNAYKYAFIKILRLHQPFVVVLAVLFILIVAMLRINSLSNVQINQSYLDQKTSEVKAVKFNSDAIKQIQELNDSNVNAPGTQLPTNRQNPFNE